MPRVWSLNALAEEFEFDRRRVTRLMKDVPPDGKIQGRFPGWYLKTAVPVLFGLHEDAGSEEGTQEEVDPDTLHPKDRKDWWDGTKTMIFLKKEAGTLITNEDHRRVLSIALQDLLHEIEPLPDILERDCEAPPEMVMKTQEIVDQARQRAYERGLETTDPT